MFKPDGSGMTKNMYKNDCDIAPSDSLLSRNNN